jgi:hypothetical protein
MRQGSGLSDADTITLVDDGQVHEVNVRIKN